MKLTSPFSQETLWVDFFSMFPWMVWDIYPFLDRVKTPTHCWSLLRKHLCIPFFPPKRRTPQSLGWWKVARSWRYQWWIYDHDELLGFKCVTCRCYVYSHLFDMWLYFHRICSCICYFILLYVCLIKCEGMFCTTHIATNDSKKKQKSHKLQVYSWVGWEMRFDRDAFFPMGAVTKTLIGSFVWRKKNWQKLPQDIRILVSNHKRCNVLVLMRPVLQFFMSPPVPVGPRVVLLFMSC